MMKLFAGVPTGEMTRYPEFWFSVMIQQLPPGSGIRWGGAKGCYIGYNQNHLGRLFLQTDCTHFLLCNDDQRYPGDYVARLASSMDAAGAGVGIGLCLNKQPPFVPLIYDRWENDASAYARLLRRGEKGVIPIVAAGGGGMLIKREVLEKIADPWWQNTAIAPAPGLPPVEVGEDLVFSRKVQRCEFKMICDLSLIVQHIGPFGISAEPQLDGSWATVLERHGTQVRIPAQMAGE